MRVLHQLVAVAHRRRLHVAGGAFFVLALALAALPGAAAEADPTGRSAADLGMEDFLKNAEVIDVEAIGEGITGSMRVTLRRDGVEHRAIFKTVDIRHNEITRSSRLEIGFRDCYCFEVAAYRIDRMLGVGLVPVTVLREINGVQGSLQTWIEDVTSLRKALEAPSEDAAGDIDLLRRRLTAMYVFDVLICNIDRTHDNILVEPSKDRFFLIDHSRAFRVNSRVKAPDEGQGLCVLDHELAEHLRRLDADQMLGQIGDCLSKSQVRAVTKRRDKLMRVLKKEGYLDAAYSEVM